MAIRLHEGACNLLREHPEKAARLVHSVMGFIEVDFAREVFQVSPKYCASLPEEYIDSTLGFIPTLKEMGYLARDLAKKEEIFYTEASEKIRPEGHHCN